MSRLPASSTTACQKNSDPISIDICVHHRELTTVLNEQESDKKKVAHIILSFNQCGPGPAILTNQRDSYYTQITKYDSSMPKRHRRNPYGRLEPVPVFLCMILRVHRHLRACLPAEAEPQRPLRRLLVDM